MTLIVTVSVAVVVVAVLRFLWRKLNSPNRPTLTSVLDTLLEIPAMLKLGPWGKSHSIHGVIKDVGTTKEKLQLLNIENSDFTKRFDIVRNTGFSKSGAKFSPLGHLMVTMNNKKRLLERLNFFSYIQRHPSISKVQVRPPIFVIGFPRTGTTFLHELLGLHESVRMHYTWEQFYPIPTTDDESIEAQEIDRAKRYKVNQPEFDFMFKYVVGEKIQHIHRIAYDEPEECTIPCSMELPWGLVDLPFMVFAAKDVLPVGAKNTFEIYKQFLQLMTWQAKDRRDQDFTWMLKCPFHLPYLEDLFNAFPGCTVVWTHRDPVECIASACSLYQTIMHMGLEEFSVNPKKIGKAVLDYSRMCLDRAEAAIKKLEGRVKVVHIRYADNIKNPRRMCENVLNQANVPFTETYQTRLDEYLKKNDEQRKKIKEKKKSSVLHEYKPEDFGLTAAEIHETFADYIEKYKLSEH